MSKIFLRVDAVNLDNFVYDTHDISTIRGGSYLLLEAVHSLKDEFEGRLNLVTQAASQGIFWFESTEDKQKLCESDWIYNQVKKKVDKDKKLSQSSVQ